MEKAVVRHSGALQHGTARSSLAGKKHHHRNPSKIKIKTPAALALLYNSRGTRNDGTGPQFHHLLTIAHRKSHITAVTGRGGAVSPRAAPPLSLVSSAAAAAAELPAAESTHYPSPDPGNHSFRLRSSDPLFWASSSRTCG